MDIYNFLLDKIKEKYIVNEILEMKDQLEHRDKFKKCLKSIKYETQSCNFYTCFDFKKSRYRYTKNNTIRDLVFCEKCGGYYKTIQYDNDKAKDYYYNCILSEYRLSNYILECHYYHSDWQIVNIKRIPYNKYRDCEC